MNTIFYLHVPAYAHLRNKFFDHFRYIRITRGLISSVTDFLAFIPPNVIVSIILAFNKFRLSINFPSVIWWLYDILLIFVSFVQFWAFNISSSLTIKHSFIHSLWNHLRILLIIPYVPHLIVIMWIILDSLYVIKQLCHHLLKEYLV